MMEEAYTLINAKSLETLNLQFISLVVEARFNVE